MEVAEQHLQQPGAICAQPRPVHPPSRRQGREDIGELEGAPECRSLSLNIFPKSRLQRSRAGQACESAAPSGRGPVILELGVQWTVRGERLL